MAISCVKMATIIDWKIFGLFQYRNVSFVFAIKPSRKKILLDSVPLDIICYSIPFARARINHRIPTLWYAMLVVKYISWWWLAVPELRSDISFFWPKQIIAHIQHKKIGISQRQQDRKEKENKREKAKKQAPTNPFTFDFMIIGLPDSYMWAISHVVETSIRIKKEKLFRNDFIYDTIYGSDWPIFFG